MKTGLIKICKKVVIDHATNWTIAQTIHEDSFRELIYQFQSLGHSFNTWEQVVKYSPKAVIGIKKLVNAGIVQQIAGLKGKIPNGLSDITKTIEIPFVDYHFDIVESDIRDIVSHKIALLFISDTLTLIDSIDDRILLAVGDKTNDLKNKQKIDTFLLELSTEITII
jgi:hypothetical protein